MANFSCILISITSVILSITKFVLGDMPLVVNFKSLESLQLRNRSITELPNKIKELEKLRLLEMVDCIIERNDPFEVIASCLQLEELYYVSNRVVAVAYDLQALEIEITQFPLLHRYHIMNNVTPFSGSLRHYHNLKCYSETNLNFSTSRYFDSKGLKVNFSKKVFQSLMERVECDKTMLWSLPC